MAITARLIQNLVHMKPEISLLPIRRLMRRLEDFGRDFVHRSGRILLPRAPREQRAWEPALALALALAWAWA